MTFTPEIQRALLETSPIPLRVAIIKELDRAERSGRRGVVDLVNAISENREDVIQPDDGSIDFSKVSREDIPLLKAALRTNFSIEKIQKIESFVVGESGSTVQDAHHAMANANNGLVELSSEASSRQISLIDIRIAIIKELDRDAKRGPQCALRAADEADAKLREKGLGLYELDDGYIEFREVKLASVTQDALTLVKASLRTNFSREKVAYAAQLIVEFRRRGLSGFVEKEVTNKSVSKPRPQATVEDVSHRTTSIGGARSQHSQSSTAHPTGYNTHETQTRHSDTRCNQPGHASDQGAPCRTSNRSGAGWATWAAIASAIAVLVFIIVKKFR